MLSSMHVPNYWSSRMSANNRKDIICTEKPRHLKEKKVGKHKAFLPYIQGVTHKIAKHLKKKSIDFVFSPLNNIKKLLKSLKDSVDPALKKGVYMVPCECGKAYIGETTRSIRTKVKEHCIYIRLDRTQKTALAQHPMAQNTLLRLTTWKSFLMLIIGLWEGWVRQFKLSSTPIV